MSHDLSRRKRTKQKAMMLSISNSAKYFFQKQRYSKFEVISILTEIKHVSTLTWRLKVAIRQAEKARRVS